MQVAASDGRAELTDQRVEHRQVVDLHADPDSARARLVVDDHRQLAEIEVSGGPGNENEAPFGASFVIYQG